MSAHRVLNPMTEQQLQDWEALVRQQKASKLIGYEWAEKTRPLLNAVVTLVSEVRALQAECARLAGELDDLERRRIAYAKQVAGATEATRKEHAEALAFQVEQRNLRHAAWLEEQRRREAAEAQRDALRSALKRYGRHEPGCHILRTYLNEPHTRPCNCGLVAALNAAPDARSAGSAPLETER